MTGQGSPSSANIPFCVLGAGNGGLAMAAHLALKGVRVHLWNRSPERLLPIQRSGYIHLIASPDRPDLPQGQAHIPVVTTDIEEAVHDARVLMVVVPASGHAEVAERLAPHLLM